MGELVYREKESEKRDSIPNRNEQNEFLLEGVKLAVGGIWLAVVECDDHAQEGKHDARRQSVASENEA